MNIPRLYAVATLLSCLGACSPATSSAEAPDTARALFAGGCFWCMEPPFDALEGVFSTTSGYTGGVEKNPTYRQVSAGQTGHAEAVEIVYDPSLVTYEELLTVFWRNIDPTVRNRQFCDAGTQYRSAIYFLDDAQRAAAEASEATIEASGQLDGPIVTEIVAAGDFYPAEEYHQDFYKKNPAHYKRYRTGCGRDRTLERIRGEAPH